MFTVPLPLVTKPGPCGGIGQGRGQTCRSESGAIAETVALAAPATAAWIRQRPELAAVKIIVLTNATSFGTMAMARDVGADLYLLKPVTDTGLAAAVAQLVGPPADGRGA